MNRKAIIISAPSGAGKTTIVKHLLKSIPRLEFSISACSRPMRSNEQNGVDYFFLSEPEFRSKIANNEFVEWQEVYTGNYYGTLKTELERIWTLGHVPIFDVDVYGGINLKKYFGANALSVFIQPPSFEILESRLRNRASDNEESIRKRLDKVRQELGEAIHFDRIVINEEISSACSLATDLVNSFIE